MGVDHYHVLRPDEDGRITVQHRLRAGLGKVNTVRYLLYFKQVGIGAGSGRASPRCTMVGKFKDRGPNQGAPHHAPEKVASRGVTSMIVGVCMPRVAVVLCVWVQP